MIFRKHLDRMNMTNIHFVFYYLFRVKANITEKAVTVNTGKMAIQQFAAIKLQLIKC